MKGDNLAFPLKDCEGWIHEGFTKREYFACLAMQGLIAEDSGQENIARQAVRHADELIEALSQG